MKASHFDTDASYMTYKINKTISEKIVRQTHYLAAMHFEIARSEDLYGRRQWCSFLSTGAGRNNKMENYYNQFVEEIYFFIILVQQIKELAWSVHHFVKKKKKKDSRTLSTLVHKPSSG